MVFVSLNTAFAGDKLTRNSSRECAICHFRWIDQFVEGHGTSLAEYEAEDVAGDEMICFSCHDGSTEDSRRKVWMLDKHKTGMQPSEKVKIPKLFPLSHEGKMICATCHSAHSNPTDTSIEHSIFLRITNNDSIMCEMCHVEQIKEQENHPIHKGKNILPQRIFAEGATPSYTDARQIICESCHTAHGGVERNLVYTMARSSLCILCHADKVDIPEVPASEGVNHAFDVAFKIDPDLNISLQSGENGSLQCLSCHKVHQHAAGTKGLVAEKRILCIFCHADKNNPSTADTDIRPNHPMGMTYRAEGTGSFVPDGDEKGAIRCFTCHKVHQHEPATKGLPVQRDILCAACHADKYLVEKTDHDLRITAPAESNILEQNAQRFGVCVSCHVPHKANGPYLWARQENDGTISPSGICLACHSDAGPASKKGVGQFTHPVGLPVKDSISLPVYAAEDKRMLMECDTCHDPHRWISGKNEEGLGINAEGDGKSSFLRLYVGGTDDLCSVCHASEYRVIGTDHDLRVTAPAELNVNGKSVFQAGVCSSCHVPHNGEGHLLWAKKLEGDQHSRSRLCLSCHLSSGVAAAKTVGRNSHPVGVVVQQDSTALPLFHKDETTVMECETCHDPHSWIPDGNNFGSVINIEGDSDNSFLRKKNLEEPLLCVECHKRQFWVTGTDHDMRVTAPDSVNQLGSKPAQGSVCSPCHAVHNASNRVILWNSHLSSSRRDFMARVCYGCHSPEGAGEQKQVGAGSHPERYYFGYNRPYSIAQHYRNDIAYEYPLFDAEGKKTPAGEITCPTCHDPHIWHPDRLVVGPGKNLEGMPIDSFLRKDVRRGLCYACHGMKTLFLYRYFHVAEERQTMIGPYSPSTR